MTLTELMLRFRKLSYSLNPKLSADDHQQVAVTLADRSTDDSTVDYCHDDAVITRSEAAVSVSDHIYADDHALVSMLSRPFDVRSSDNKIMQFLTLIDQHIDAPADQRQINKAGDFNADY